MSVFEFENYRSYLKTHIRNLPRKGRGELSQIAKHLRVNTTLLSQIMAGTRDFSFEQAHALSTYLAHTDLESDYFQLLVQIERASTHDYKKHLQKKLSLIKKEALKLSQRIAHEKNLTENDRAIFYSSWIYSAVHLFTSVKEKGVSHEEIASRFFISKQKSVDIMQFLLRAGICIESDGRYKMGLQSTFVERDSPYLLRHHANWRVKAIQKSENIKDEELMCTAQFSLSKKDFSKIREQLINYIKQTNTLVKDSPSEEIACLNIDWFWIDP